MGEVFGAIDYDQKHHRDFGNHSLVVPRVDGLYRQLRTFILLSDVTVDDAPTAVVPLKYSGDVAFVPEERDPRFGFRRPGHPYWDAQTIRDVGRRYPLVDMSTYVPRS